MITEEQVVEAQRLWGEGVVEIGKRKDSPDLKEYTKGFLKARYAYDYGTVLFKPTKCELIQFRLTEPEALSYFINGEDRACPEDKGFALQPWTNVRFENAGFILEEKRALAMGNYFFANIQNEETKVEYSFGYTLVDGTLRIDLHHSSIPYEHPEE